MIKKELTVDEYFDDPVNTTMINERCIELALGLRYIEKVGNDKLTEVGCVMPFYGYCEHPIIDLFEKAAIELGFTKKNAKELVYQTAFGSIKLLINNSKSAEKLTNDIAIKGGTTEAAIRFFKKNNQLKNMINKAVKAAHKRAIELSKK